ncbi:cytochrome P450 [Streptomyces sp. NBC_00162]|uniref:cytochrome P450 n=1 Tax=Streptomyces sp. NBC_00162 TaxID=2903629 RepID=UPI00214BFACD|nr:cytochrome P450 [Streptomyces sp. NBC_00162]UUU45072.1 cytochrome P450 [Streptomyces sp. NBC_00162]
MRNTLCQPVKLPTERPSPLDPPLELGVFRDRDPVTPMLFPDGHRGWLVTSHSLVRSVLADQRFSARQELHHHAAFDHPFGTERITPAEPGQFIGMDPPEHTRYRKLLTKHFTARRIRELAPRIEEIVEQRLDALEAAGRGADLVAEFAVPIPTLLICEILGVPYAEQDMFRHDVATFFRLDSTQEETHGAYAGMLAYLGGLVPRRRAAPGADLISGLIEGNELSDQEIATVALVVLIAGHETTASMLGLGVYTLLSHPDQWAGLRAEPDLLDSAVEELLRYLPLFRAGLMRTALTDVDLGGHRISAGECLVLSLSAANRDPRRFDGDPERFDPGRKPGGHLSFGHGVHQCLGHHLARVELRIAYAALLRRFPRLRMAVPAEEIPLCTDMAIYGVHRLPVTW